MPVHLDVPDIDVMWIDIPDPRAPVGARGVGEIGITGVVRPSPTPSTTPRVGGFANCRSHQTSFSRAEGEPALGTSPASTRSCPWQAPT
jgi:hypothetical protein